MHERWGQGCIRVQLIGLLVFAAGLAAAPAQADFACGAGNYRCQVQIDNSGRAWYDSWEKLTEDALGEGTPNHRVTQIYEWTGDKLVLASKTADGKPIPAENKRHDFSAHLIGVSADGERIYIATEASLSPADGDAGHELGSMDDYELSNGTYTLLSTGPLDNPNASESAAVLWASEDGQHVYFETAQQLTPDDLDNHADIYERSGGQTRLVSTGPDQVPQDGPGAFVPDTDFLGASADGATAYFSTTEHLTADDLGGNTFDIFAWRDGVTRRPTHTEEGSQGGFSHETVRVGPGNSLYVTTGAQLAPDDTDAIADIYKLPEDGPPTRVTSSPPGTIFSGPKEAQIHLEAVSRDGSHVFLLTGRRLVSADHDETLDLYRSGSGHYDLISLAGPAPSGEEELDFCAVSANGNRAYFNTWAQLSPQDTDEEYDAYEWNEGTVRLVSPASNSDGPETSASCTGISPNGRYVAISTTERLLPGDTDLKADTYLIDMGGEARSRRLDARASTSRPRRQRHKIHLITGEEIPPRMGVGRTALLMGRATKLRLTCPRSEQSGPCHGRAKLLDPRSHRVLGAGTFRIAVGKTTAVALHGLGLSHPNHVLARVTGADALQNRATVSVTVSVRRR